MSHATYRRLRWGSVIVVGLVLAVFAIGGGLAGHALDAHRAAPPPPGGYFSHVFREPTSSLQVTRSLVHDG